MQYIIKSPHHTNQTGQRVYLAASGSGGYVNLNEPVTLTQDQVDALNAGGYNPCLLDSDGRPSAAFADQLPNDAKDPAPTACSLTAPADAATTITLAHTGIGILDYGFTDVWRDRDGTITKQAAAADLDADASTTITLDEAVEGGDVYWAEAWYGGSAKVRTANVNCVHATPAISGTPDDNDTAVAGTSGAKEGTIVTLYSDGVAVGTDATAADGAWSVTYSPTLGAVLKARVDAGTAFQSAFSATKTVVAH